MTPQSVSIVIFKKDITARDWPDLSKTALPYVKADLSQWTREGDESDDAEADCSADIIDMDMDSSSAGTKSGALLQVSTLRIDFMVYAFANEIKAKSMLNFTWHHNAGNSTSLVGAAKFAN